MFRYISGGLGILLFAVGLTFAYYYKTSQARIEQLVSNNSTLEANIQTYKDLLVQSNNTIDQLQKEFDRVVADFEETQNLFNQTREQNSALKERLSEHEIDVLANAKPGLVGAIINNASINAIRCFEILSGSPLTELEKNATTPEKFNSECPWLWEPK